MHSDIVESSQSTDPQFELLAAWLKGMVSIQGETCPTVDTQTGSKISRGGAIVAKSGLHLSENVMDIPETSLGTSYLPTRNNSVPIKWGA